MRGGVYFDDGADATHASVVDDGLDVSGGVGLVRGIGTIPSEKQKLQLRNRMKRIPDIVNLKLDWIFSYLNKNKIAFA